MTTTHAAPAELITRAMHLEHEARWAGPDERHMRDEALTLRQLAAEAAESMASCDQQPAMNDNLPTARGRIMANNPHSPRSRRTVNPCAAWRPIIKDVAASHKVHPRDMLSGMRSYKFVDARHELWWRLNERGVALMEIGRRFGGYHHTTVMHGVRKFAAGMEHA